MGAQGGAPVMTLIGVLALPLLIWKRPKISLDFLVFCAFLLWIVITVTWADNHGNPLVEFDLSTGVIAVKSAGLRIVLSALIFAYAFWALSQLKAERYNRAVWAGRIGLGIQALLMVGWVFAFSALEAYGRSQTDEASMYQNMMRVVNISVLMVPLLVALLPVRNVWVKAAAFVLCMVGLFIIARRPVLDVSAAILAIPAVSLMVGLSFILKQHIYRLLGYGTAALILLMPAFIALLSRVAGDGASLPASFKSRIDSYQYVFARIQEKFLFGWGVGTTAGWDETTRVAAPDGTIVDYPIVPGHPHNGGLHVWAETGLIGALLLAAFAILLGERLARTSNKNTDVIMSATGIWTGALILASLSYSLWNDAFWGAIVLCASCTMAISRSTQMKTQKLP